MFVVYWLEHEKLEGMGEGPSPGFQTFGKDDMSAALKFMEELRTQQRSGERNIAFITMCSENPNAVGKTGAADPDPDYAWTKRRGNMPRAKRDLQVDDYKDN
ncbi:MAG: hypothetical protein ACO1NO_09265 [Burkholderiaceae bacterium]